MEFSARCVLILRVVHLDTRALSVSKLLMRIKWVSDWIPPPSFF